MAHSDYQMAQTGTWKYTLVIPGDLSAATITTTITTTIIISIMIISIQMPYLILPANRSDILE